MARDFDGSADEAVNSSPSNIDTNKVTALGWVSLDSMASGESIINFRPTSNIGSWTLEGSTSVNGRFYTYIASWGYAEGITYFSTDGYHCYAGTHDASNVKIFKDGVEFASPAWVGNLNSPTSPLLKIGANIQGGQKIDGKIGECVIWSDALDANFLTALAHGVNPFVIRNDILIFYCPMYGNESPESDYIKQQNKMTLTSAPPKTIHPPVQLLSRWLSMC